MKTAFVILMIVWVLAIALLYLPIPKIKEWRDKPVSPKFAKYFLISVVFIICALYVTAVAAYFYLGGEALDSPIFIII